MCVYIYIGLVHIGRTCVRSFAGFFAVGVSGTPCSAAPNRTQGNAVQFSKKNAVGDVHSVGADANGAAESGASGSNRWIGAASVAAAVGGPVVPCAWGVDVCSERFGRAGSAPATPAAVACTWPAPSAVACARADASAEVGRKRSSAPVTASVASTSAASRAGPSVFGAAPVAFSAWTASKPSNITCCQATVQSPA